MFRRSRPRGRLIDDEPSGFQSSSPESSLRGVSEMRRLIRFGGGGLLRGDASSFDADTRVGSVCGSGVGCGLGERFVFATSAARGGVGGFLRLAKKSVMERCCDMFVFRSCAPLPRPRACQ